MAIGERIKSLRNMLGYSQVDFANKIGVSKQTLYKYENNIITNIPSDKIEAIADACNVPPSYLMGWEEEVRREDRHGEEFPYYYDDETSEIAHDMYFNARSILEVYKTDDRDKLIEYANTLLLARRFRTIELNAAHERTDIEISEEMKQHDDAFFDDED